MINSSITTSPSQGASAHQILANHAELEARLSKAANAAALGAVNAISGALTEHFDETERRIAGLESLRPAVMRIELPDLTQIQFEQPVSSYLPEILPLLSAGLIPVMVGPRGSGKTTTAKQAAKALGVPLYAVTFSAAMTKSDIYGSYTAQGYAPSLVEQAVKAASLGTKVMLFIDEIDAGSDQMMVALNNLFDLSGIFSNMVTGEMHRFDPANLIILAGANTYSRGASSAYTGRNKLDAATIDRFWPVAVNYCEALELTIASAYGADAKTLLAFLWGVRSELAKAGSEETISTRKIAQIFKAHFVAKLSLDACFKAVSGGWSEGLAEQVGLVDKPKAAKAGRK